ncbi:MAG: PhnD/SsuA/transferrin family substrate-binding protein [Myxococcota bacterium]
MSSIHGWKFSLPPSVGDPRTRAAQVRTALSTIGCSTVRTSLNYAALMDELLNGAVAAAWAPPLVCARLEANGGRVLLRARRGGAASYRAVLFARAEKGLTLENLRGTRAGWLDEQSMSGYVLPLGTLRAAGVDPTQTFSQQKFLGAYPACVQAVLDGRVDLSSTYASSATVDPPRVGFAELAGARAHELAVVAYSVECPNDGIVLSPRHADEWEQFVNLFDSLLQSAAPARALAKALEVDDFDVPPPGSYRALAEHLKLEKA